MGESSDVIASGLSWRDWTLKSFWGFIKYLAIDFASPQWVGCWGRGNGGVILFPLEGKISSSVCFC